MLFQPLIASRLVVFERAAFAQLGLEMRSKLDLLAELVLAAVVDEYEMRVVRVEQHVCVGARFESIRRVVRVAFGLSVEQRDLTTGGRVESIQQF